MRAALIVVLMCASILCGCANDLEGPLPLAPINNRVLAIRTAVYACRMVASKEVWGGHWETKLENGVWTVAHYYSRRKTCDFERVKVRVDGSTAEPCDVCRFVLL